MIKLVSIDEIREIEASADASGISYDQLMQNAGRAVADHSLQIIKDISQPRITILVGSGNNGGDGLVAGLFIAQDMPEAEVRFYLLKSRPEDDPYLSVAQEADLFIVNAEDDHDFRLLRNMVASADLVIDALFGIGVRLPLRDDAAKLLRMVNQAINARRRETPDMLMINPAAPNQIPRPPRLHVLAVDCPSGLDCDSGDIDQNIIPADETITFIAAKPGLLTFPGAEVVGELYVANAGIPADFKALKAKQDVLVDAETVQKMLPQRSQNSHKGTHGRVLIVGGSVNYMGAPALAAEAAYRSGAGLVTVATARPVAAALAGQLHEATWLLLPHDMGIISENAVAILTEDGFDKFNAMLVGPGMGHDKASAAFLEALLAQGQAADKTPPKRSLGFSFGEAMPEEQSDRTKITLPSLILDADALNILAEIDDWHMLLPENTILTPHPGEMARLAKIENADVQANRIILAREKAQAWNVILVLKGAHTIIASPDGKIAVLPFKTDALATAGTGDVLAGVIATCRAGGLDAFDAAIAGGYIHGLAGKMLEKEQGARGTIAGDVAQQIGIAIQVIQQ